MLRETKCILPYPNKTVVEDLVTRVGKATYESFSPFEGKMPDVEDQFKGRAKFRFKQSEFIKYSLKNNKDLNPSAVRVVKREGLLEEVDTRPAGYDTLEDLMENGVENPKVAQFINNLCVGYKKNSSSPYIQQHEYYTYTLRNTDGDDDNEIEEKFLSVLSEKDCVSNEEYERIIEELPYIMKSIWTYSKLYHANLFSFIFAYMDIRTKDRHRQYVNISDFMSYPTFLINQDGSYVRDFVHANDNKYMYYPNVTKIFIAPEDHQDEFRLCKKFIDSVILLGIDYRDENPREYNNEFINSIVCTYLPTNDEYFNSYKDVDIEITIALRPENIFNATKASLYVNTSTPNISHDFEKSAYFATERIKLAYKSGEIDNDFLCENEQMAKDILTRILRLETGVNDLVLPDSGLTFEANGLVYFNKKLLTLPGKYFGFYKNTQNYTVALTGYNFVLILLDTYDVVPYITYEDCDTTIKEFEKYGTVQADASWRRLGA